MIAQLNGSSRRERIAHQVRQGFWLAGLCLRAGDDRPGYRIRIIRSMHNIDPALADKGRAIFALYCRARRDTFVSGSAKPVRGV